MLVVPKFLFWEEDWALIYNSMKFWDFPDLYQFPKILSLKLFTCIMLGHSKPTQQGSPCDNLRCAETLHICSNKWNHKILKILASKLNKQLDKYSFSMLGQFYNFLKNGLEKWQSGIYKLLYLIFHFRWALHLSWLQVLNKMMQIN